VNDALPYAGGMVAGAHVAAINNLTVNGFDYINEKRFGSTFDEHVELNVMRGNWSSQFATGYYHGKYLTDTAMTVVGAYETAAGLKGMAATPALALVTGGTGSIAAAPSFALAGYGALLSKTSSSNLNKDLDQYRYYSQKSSKSTNQNQVKGLVDEGAGKTVDKLGSDALKKIGVPAKNSGIRAVTGNADDALEFFKGQVNSNTIKEIKPGTFVGKDSNGLTFTYRAFSKSGPPTIDVKGVSGLRKIKFINGGATK